MGRNGARRKRIAGGLVLGGLALLVGLDLIGRPAPPSARGFSLVDGVSAATRSGTSVVGLVASDDEHLKSPSPRDTELTEAQVEEMVRYAVAMAGGLHSHLASDARWVAIKPNIVELKERGSGVITDWRVVKALAKIVHEVAPQARITIAEGGAWIPPEREEVFGGMRGGGEIGDGFAVAGYRQLLSDPELAGIDLDIVDLNFDETAEVAVPDGGYVFPKYHIPLTVLECDFLISVPVLKIIGGVGMTNAMKNFVGIAPGMIYGWPKMTGFPGSGVPGLPHEPGILDEVIVDLVSVAEPDFAVVDAIVGMERAKTDEDNGRPVRLNAILASADIVAADAVSAQLIGLNPDDLEYLSLAAYRGLGQADLGKIKVKGTPLEKVARRFEKYPADNRFYGEHGHYGQGCRTWLLKGPFAAQSLVGEAIEVQNPEALPGQNGWSAPVYFHDDRIDLDKYYDNPFDCVVYAYATFTAAKDQEAELWVGSDEGLRVWINGELVYDYQGRRRHRLPNDRQPIRIRAGENALLVRASQTRGRFDFSLNICEPEPDPRYDGNRVWGLKFGVPVSPATAGKKAEELAFAATAGTIPADAKILEGARLEFNPDMLLGALGGCLSFLGTPLSPEVLIGSTGHAFRFCVADSLEVEGINQIDLASALELYQNLGYEIRYIGAAADEPTFADRQEEAWEAIRESIDRKVPAVVRSGAFFWVVKGYHERTEQYYLSGFRRDTEPMEMSELGTDEQNGRLDVLIIGPPRKVDPVVGARRVIEFAVQEAHRPPEGRYHWGLNGYQHWISELEAGRVSRGFGMRLAAGVAAGRRAQAGPYLRQVAPFFPAAVAAHLQEAARCYEAEAEILNQVASLFPFMGRRGEGRGERREGIGPQVQRMSPPPGGAPGPWREAERQQQAVPLIREAYQWEQQAVAQLEEALAQLVQE